jgi:hypothetical protein
MKATVEHILPENPGERIGNYSLHERGLNVQQAANAAFAQKQDAYAQSKYKTSTQLTQVTEWTEEAIAKRQRDMARVAKSIWSLAL